MKSITGLIGACLCCSLLAAPAKAQDSAGKLTNEICPQGYSLVVGVCIAEQTGDVVLPVDIKQAEK
ncbi:MAG TPA: hypothetical protein VFL51_15825 [Pseudolabrys sp.]|nr:hypothetical protein [Pseudolabrys sp.]